MYDAIVRSIYRVIAPGHPRGHIRFDAAPWKNTGNLWVHTHGMRKYGLDDVELADVPPALRGYAHGLLFEIIGYMKSCAAILPDQSIGGLWISEDQPAYHLASARLIARPGDLEHSRALRFVDYQEAAEVAFPRRLFSAHISAIAARARNPAKREKLFRIATTLVTASDQVDTADPRDNVNNWVAWEGLGSALCDLGRIPEGIECLSIAMARSATSMRTLAEMFRTEIENGNLPAPDADPRSRFWHDLGA